MALSQGSIGALWPPKYDASNQRVKGLDNRSVVTSEKQLRRTLEEAVEVRRAHPEATRVTVRAFVRANVLTEGMVVVADNVSFRVEASMDTGNAINGTRLTYFAHNEPSRISSDDLRRAEKTAVHEIVATPRKRTAKEILTRVHEGRYSIERLSGTITPDDLQALLGLYAEAYPVYTFAIDETAVRGMASNGNIFLAARAADGTIVSAMTAEHVGFEVGEIPVGVYEFSDYATRQAHGGKGLMAALQIIAARIVRNGSDGRREIAHSENRGPWTAVHSSSHSAGLVPAQNSKKDSIGLLNQQCTITAVTNIPGQIGPYEDLVPWVVPRDVL